MTWLLAYLGFCAWRIGSWQSLDSEGNTRMCWPEMAGCGAAVMLGAATAAVLL